MTIELGSVAMVLFFTPAASGVITGVAAPMSSAMPLLVPTHTLPEPWMDGTGGLVEGTACVIASSGGEGGAGLETGDAVLVLYL